MSTRTLLTSESVTEGHPDKICDQISDAVLDKVLDEDTKGRVACETLTTRGLVMVAGEISTNCYVDVPQIVRDVVKAVGYNDPCYGFDYESCAIVTSIQEQSSDIAQGVDIGGAGDQGMMFGYATDETKELMPFPIVLAHRLVRRLAEVRKTGNLKYLRPDGKSQVTVEYKDGKPFRIDTVILSAQHNPDASNEDMKKDLMEKVVREVISDLYLDGDTNYFINPTGRFVIGGPQADTGVTGRKIMVDTYGGLDRHGGGCFSGKDPSKVDRSASYMARYIAKNIVAAELAQKCSLQISYAIGMEEPISLSINSFGTGRVSDEELVKAILKVFDLTPKGIIAQLDLLRPIYRNTACYGHFGRDEEDFTWEKTDMAEELASTVSPQPSAVGVN
jgi:S-adenosylmethionine synthetase